MNLKELESKIDYTFETKDHLELALTHPSAVKGKDNQRMEFFGDAILQMALSELLYSSYRQIDEGRLTQIRAASVNRQSLSQVAKSIDLGKFIRFGKGESKSDGSKKDSNLADTMEAVICAIYLDSDYETVKDWIEDHFQEILAQATDQDQVFNPKGQLQEYLQSKGLPTPEYRLISEDGPDHSKVYTVQVISEGEVLGTGSGASKKVAEQEAARLALDSN
ncbi:MAG: ribonuclease III [Verrucomicrobiota bacterium]